MKLCRLHAVALSISWTTLSGIGAERFKTFASVSSLGPNSICLSLIHSENEVEAGNRAWPMCDDNNNSIACSDAKNCARQRFIAFGIEI